MKVHVVGTLEDGTVFEDSEKAGSPIAFQLGSGQVVMGLDGGLNGMRVGGTRVLHVPSHLAYGYRRVGDIPPNSVSVACFPPLRQQAARSPAQAGLDLHRHFESCGGRCSQARADSVGGGEGCVPVNAMLFSPALLLGIPSLPPCRPGCPLRLAGALVATFGPTAVLLSF